MLNIFKWLKRSKIKREIIINVEKLETRVAVLENGRLEEFMVEHPEEERLVAPEAELSDVQVENSAEVLENWDAIKDYLNLLDKDLNTVDTVIKTGNAMTDAILNSKINLARSKDIYVKADAHIPYELKIAELDLCVIIGNLFDNAIEASLELPKEQRLIRVYMDMKGTQLYISFTNFCAGKKKVKVNGRF